jgi:protein-S-isoprenylcysteine O-methyltransferase Ste14
VNRQPHRDRKPWWTGARGEWFVVGQTVLFGMVAFGPRTLPGRSGSSVPWPHPWAVIGVALMAVGLATSLAGLMTLGRRLTPLPFPKDGADLLRTGPFALVRHPIYSGILALALGWALYVQGWLTLGYVVALLVLLDAKSRREERWLVDKFPEYAAYRRRVRRFVPFVY